MTSWGNHIFFRISLRGSKERKVKPKKKLKKNIKIRLRPRMGVGVEPPTQLWFYFNQAVIPLLDHRDKDVREEGKKLIIESYRWIGNTYHLLIILSCRVSHILLDRAQLKKLGFSELMENFKTLNHSKKLYKLHAENKRFFEYFVLNLMFKHRDHPIWYGTL